MTQRRRCVVFGGTGFIGSAVCELLAGAGREVIRIGRTDSDVTDLDSVRQSVCEGDVIVNAAGVVKAEGDCWRQAAEFERVNVEGAANVARAAHLAGVRGVVHISSVAAQGAVRGRGLTEDAIAGCTTAYARSKRHGEEALVRNLQNVPYVILRPTSIFGGKRALTRQLLRLSRMRMLLLPRGGRVLIPFCHVLNVAHAVRTIIDHDRYVGCPVIIGDRGSVELRAALRVMARAQKRRILILGMPKAVFIAFIHAANGVAKIAGRGSALDEPRMRTLTEDIEFSIDRARELFGYDPHVDTLSGFRRLAQHGPGAHHA